MCLMLLLLLLFVPPPHATRNAPPPRSEKCLCSSSQHQKRSARLESLQAHEKASNQPFQLGNWKTRVARLCLRSSHRSCKSASESIQDVSDGKKLPSDQATFALRLYNPVNSGMFKGGFAIWQPRLFNFFLQPH